MTKDAEYLEFKYIGTSRTGLTRIFDVRSASSKHFLGEVKWYARWRRYVFVPKGSTVFDSSCLKQIEKFLSTLMEEQEAQKKGL